MTQPFTEGAAEGGTDNWGEVVTREPYRKVRLDHLLSKEEQVKNGFHCLVIKERQRDKGNIRNEKETESRRLYSFKN